MIVPDKIHETMFNGTQVIMTSCRKCARCSAVKTPTDMWIGTNHLPVQIQVSSSQGTMTIVYSKYNEVADITPPM